MCWPRVLSLFVHSFINIYQSMWCVCYWLPSLIILLLQQHCTEAISWGISLYPNVLLRVIISEHRLLCDDAVQILKAFQLLMKPYPLSPLLKETSEKSRLYGHLWNEFGQVCDYSKEFLFWGCSMLTIAEVFLWSGLTPSSDSKSQAKLLAAN